MSWTSMFKWASGQVCLSEQVCLMTSPKLYVTLTVKVSNKKQTKLTNNKLYHTLGNQINGRLGLEMFARKLII